MSSLSVGALLLHVSCLTLLPTSSVHRQHSVFRERLVGEDTALRHASMPAALGVSATISCVQSVAHADSGYWCCAKVVREVEADILLEELTRLMSKVEQRPVSAAEAKGWTIDQWMTMHFRVCVCACACIILLQALLHCLQADMLDSGFWGCLWSIKLHINAFDFEHVE